MKMLDKKYCPKLVEGVETAVLFQNKGGTTYSMGSRFCDRYIQLNEYNKKPVEIVTGYMDGKTTLSEIEEKMIYEHRTRINVTRVCEWLAKAGLIENPPDDVSLEKQEMDYLSITVKKWNLEKLCSVFSFLGQKNSRRILVSCILLFLTGVVVAALNWQEFILLQNYELNESLLFGVIWMLIVFSVSIGLHEMGHAVVGYHFGLQPRELVFALYVGTPMFYVKIPGIYTIAPKKRIIVWSAGVFVNLVIASICVLMMQLTSGNLRNLILIGVTTNVSLVFANLSPLLPLDGYFIMSTLLQRPNLRKGAFLQFKKWILRKQNNFNGLYIIYFLISVSFYTAVIIYELRKIVEIISYGIKHQFTIVDYMYEFRLIGIILSIILLKKLVDFIASGIIAKKIIVC